MNKIIFILFLGVFLVSGCTNSINKSSTNITTEAIVDQITIDTKTESIVDQAIAKCTRECKDRIELGFNLSKGPCLSDEDINWMIEDWVCDVAHSPREEIDNLPENQCQAFREENAHHFVEVSPICELIKAV